MSSREEALGSAIASQLMSIIEERISPERQNQYPRTKTGKPLATGGSCIYRCHTESLAVPVPMNAVRCTRRPAPVWMVGQPEVGARENCNAGIPRSSGIHYRYQRISGTPKRFLVRRGLINRKIEFYRQSRSLRFSAR